MVLIMTKCPYCEQFTLWEVVLPNMNTYSYICYECETYWERDDQIDNKHGSPFENVVLLSGDPADWATIKKIKRL